MRALILSLLLLLPAGAGAAGARRKCRVVGVSDGDTLTVLCARNERKKVRLAEIDAPEKRQAFGDAAKRFCSSLAYDRDVVVVERDTDRYGRLVAQVLLPDGRSLNRELVAAGYAWWYKQYSKDKSLGELEAEARRERRGLWAEEAPIRPSEFRRKPKTPAGV